MNYLDILYTPLDTSPLPAFNIDRLLSWIDDNKDKQHIQNRADSSKMVSKYPWNIIYPKTLGKWQYNFNIEFPELAEYFSSCFDLAPQDVLGVVLLPVKSEFTGVGFWHSDPDVLGLRMYLENKESNDFLLVRPTVEAYITRPPFTLSTDNSDIKLQDSIYSAKLLNPTQSYFINNVRAMHAVTTSSAGILRIAALIFVSPHVAERMQELIIRSAEKFKRR